MFKLIMCIFILMADLVIVIYGLYSIFFSLIDKGESKVIKIRQAIIITLTLVFPAFYFWGKLLTRLYEMFL